MNESDYYIIDQYLRGELTPAEQILFEKRLLTEADLANELKMLHQIKKDLIAKEKEGLAQKINSWRAEALSLIHI